jgi:hypothetical protein
MKKHILGLGLFSFIVITAGFIYSMFSVANVEEVLVIKNIEPYESHPMPNSCWKMKRASKESNVGKLTVKQAVFDLQTKHFNWELATPDIDEMIELQFFSNDGKNVKYIASERVNNKFSHNGSLKFSNSSYGWLSERNSYKNLYVIARFESEMKNYSENYQAYGNRFQPKFDAAKATAVTVDYGE